MYYVCRTTKNLKQKKMPQKEKSACFFVLDCVLVCVVELNSWVWNCQIEEVANHQKYGEMKQSVCSFI